MLAAVVVVIALLLGAAFALGVWYGSDAPLRAQVWLEMRRPGRDPFAGPHTPLSDAPHMRELMGEVTRNKPVYWRGILPNVRSER